jgi:hypothetical protein
MKIGHNMKRALEFAKTYPTWHYFTHDRATTNAINKLVKMGLVEVNSSHQFKIMQEAISCQN